MRIRDLKAELRRRECNPLKITWKGIVIKKIILNNITLLLLLLLKYFVFI